jgi:hypothetical protein
MILVIDHQSTRRPAVSVVESKGLPVDPVVAGLRSRSGAPAESAPGGITPRYEASHDIPFTGRESSEPEGIGEPTYLRARFLTSCSMFL